MGPVDAWRKQRPPTPTELIDENVETIFACAELNANLIASTPLHMYLRTRKGEPKSKTLAGYTRPITRSCWKNLERNPSLHRKLAGADEYTVEQVVDHPALMLLDNPTDEAEDDSAAMSFYQLIKVTQLYLELIGRAYWYIKNGPLGTPAEIWVMASQYMVEILGGGGGPIIDYYQFGFGAEKTTYRPEEIVAFRMVDPHNPYVGGWSPLRACIEQTRIARKINATEQAVLDNAVNPKALFTPRGSDDGYGIGEAEAERLQWKLNTKFRAAGSGGIMVAENAGQITPLFWPVRDLADLKQLELTATRIANAFSVPDTKLNRNAANLAAALTADYAHAVDAGVPRVHLMDAALNAFYLPKWDTSGRLFFAHDSPVPDDKVFQLEQTRVAGQFGAFTVNEIRKSCDMEPLDDEAGEVRFINNQMVPIMQDGMPDPAYIKRISSDEGGNSKEDDNAKSNGKSNGKAFTAPHHRLPAG